MSIEYMSMVLNRPTPKAAGQRLVLLVLADHANESGVCWPSVPLIARKACMTERGVQLALRSMEQARLLNTVKGGINAQSRERFANTYKITWGEVNSPKGEHSSPPGELNTPPGELTSPVNGTTETGEHSSPPPVNKTADRGEHSSPQSSGNRHEEPSGNHQGVEEPGKPSKPGKNHSLWTTELDPELAARVVAVGELMHRRPATVWSAKELEALRKARIDSCDQEDFAEQLDVMRAYYSTKISRDQDIRRRDLLTLLNNWTGELDRARAWVRDHNDGVKKL